MKTLLKSTTEFAKDIEFRDVIAYFIKLIPIEVREPIGKIITKWHK